MVFALIASVWAADSCAAPIDQICAVSASSKQDPHFELAHGGIADFRGTDNKMYALLSAPGMHVNARTRANSFLLPNGPLLVHGSFFTEIAFVVQGKSQQTYGIHASSGAVGFDVLRISPVSNFVTAKRGVWQLYDNDGFSVLFKQATLVVRAQGWEVNATRNPIYGHVSGPSRWRFDISTRTLSGTSLEKKYGAASKTCFPHGLIGQSYDGDDLAVDGKLDNYKFDPLHPVVTTTAQAEGAIEGIADDYTVESVFDTGFKYPRFTAAHDDVCLPRNVSKLTGHKRKSATAHRIGAML